MDELKPTYQKKIHFDSFPIHKKPLLEDDGKSRYEWVEVAPGKMRLVKKEGEE